MHPIICGIPYTVNWETDGRHISHGGEGASLWGEISFDQHSINCLTSIPQQELRTVLHEILHAIVEHDSVRELQDDCGEHLEPPINQLTNGLAGVLESLGIDLLAALRKPEAEEAEP